MSLNKAKRREIEDHDDKLRHQLRKEIQLNQQELEGFESLVKKGGAVDNMVGKLIDDRKNSFKEIKKFDSAQELNLQRYNTA